MIPRPARLVPLFPVGPAMPAAGQTTAVVHAGVISAGPAGAGGDDDSVGSRTGGSAGGAVAAGARPNPGTHLGGTCIREGASIGALAGDIVNAFCAGARLPLGAASLHLPAGPAVAFEVRWATDPSSRRREPFTPGRLPA